MKVSQNQIRTIPSTRNHVLPFCSHFLENTFQAQPHTKLVKSYFRTCVGFPISVGFRICVDSSSRGNRNGAAYDARLGKYVLPI